MKSFQFSLNEIILLQYYGIKVFTQFWRKNLFRITLNMKVVDFFNNMSEI